MTDLPFPDIGAQISMQGKTAVITGAAKGIGLGCARVLGAAGASIAGIDIDAPSLETAIQQLQDNGVKAKGFPIDVSSPQAIQEGMQNIVQHFGQIDVLINNAGTHDGKSTEEADLADWERVINTNLRSVFLVTKAALEMLKQSHGSIVNMGSMVGLVGQASAGAYAASKGGIIALTKNMALDYAPYGIRVNCICPGWIATPLVDDWFELQPDEPAARQYVDSIHPLQRIGSIDDVGHVALFLTSAQAAFVTGIAVPVDGGVTLGY